MSEKKARIINIGPQAASTNYKIIPLGATAEAGEHPVLIPFRKKNRWGFCTADKKIVVPCTYENTNAFTGGLAAVQLHEKCGYIDTTGKIVLPCKYDFAGFFKEGLAVVCIKDKYGFINKAGNIVIKAEYNFASDFEDGLAIVELKGKFGFIDTTGNRVIPCKFDEVSAFKSGLAYVELGGKDIFIDKTGKEVPEPENGIFVEGFSVDYSEDEDAFGYIDEQLKPLTPHVYEAANDFSEGLAAVCMDDLWGFIDTTGQLVIPCKYEDVLVDFENGLALVETDTDLGYIGKDGTEYWEEN